jgi:hypothetical protein
LYHKKPAFYIVCNKPKKKGGNQMAVSLFKLVMSATTTTTTTTHPAVSKYFEKLTAGQRTSGTITIPSTAFTNDAGAAVTSNLVTKSTNNGYYLLFVNGVLQQSNLFTVGASGSQVRITKCSLVPLSAPITLVVNNFAPVSTATTTVTS